MYREYTRDGFTISTDPSRLDIDMIHQFLSHAYWSEEIPRELVERAIDHSLCFGVYRGRQVGLARVITDYATFGYLCDVFVLEEFRGKGIGTWLMECVMSHPDLQGFRRWILLTRDAHALYRKFGFSDLKNPARYMEIGIPDIYKSRNKSQ